MPYICLMAKNNIQTYKWRQKQFDKDNGNHHISKRTERRESESRMDYIREEIKDKFWYDSLTYAEKDQVLYYWMMYNQSDNWWSTDDIKVEDGETREDYCKRKVPGCPHKQRELKLKSLLRTTPVVKRNGKIIF